MTGLHSAVATFPLASVTDALPAQKTPAAIVPSLRILFLSDVLTPGPTLSPAGSREIVAMARARGIAVDRVVGGRGGIAVWANVERAAAR